jgi:phage gpG-like protein
VAAGVSVKLIGEWKRALRTTNKLARGYKRAQDQAIAQEAQQMAKKMVRKVESGVPPALEPSTLAVRKRGGTKTLQATGGLKRSIKAHKVDTETWFAGILKTAKSGTGEGLANLGSVHEKGATIVVDITPRSRRFLMAKFRAEGILEPKGSFGLPIAVVKIPERPFITPVIEAEDPGEIRKRIEQRFQLLFVV